ncbi:hypothetical protein AB6A40_004278 [Gnathostoma spinigerum]|uniref:Uncharacterized protein n=1 Tax=Gnathostoma spinigerum TaxID=75299 RepID=A0ABD6EJP4_9BILA
MSNCKFKRPADDDSYTESRVIRAKPISAHIARKLGPLAQGKDFIIGSSKSQNELSGNSSESVSSRYSDHPSIQKSFTADELNKLNAKILKAELKGDMHRAAKLKERLNAGSIVHVDQDQTRLLLKTDARTGLTVPVTSTKCGKIKEKTEDGKYNLGSVESKFHATSDLRDMAREERTTSAEDQLAMFSRTSRAAESSKLDDDWVVDDAMLSHRRKRKNEEKDEKRGRQKIVREFEQFLYLNRMLCLLLHISP